MNDRLDFYKELLTLDPASKVFFPLAERLMEQGKHAEASSALEKGLAVHPEHLRARLLLVEALSLQGSEDQARTQVDAVAEQLSAYPRFFSLWSQSGNSPTQEHSLALELLSTQLQGSEASLTDIFRAGLAALQGKDIPEASQAPKGGAGRYPAGFGPEDFDMEPPAQPDVDTPSAAPAAFEETAAPMVVEEPAAQDDEDDDQPSLRTRTMADLLAAQGDVKGALDILEELLNRALDAGDEEEQAELAATMEALKGGPRISADGQSGGKEYDSGRMISLLSRLADRLERRAAN